MSPEAQTIKHAATISLPILSRRPTSRLPIQILNTREMTTFDEDHSAGFRRTQMAEKRSPLLPMNSYGPRVCPGKKFRQVEYVAVPATTLRSHHIKPATKGVETSDQVKHRLIGMIDDSVFALVANLRRAEDACSVLEERWGETTSQMGKASEIWWCSTAPWNCVRNWYGM
jgi:hypothetical protein